MFLFNAVLQAFLSTHKQVDLTPQNAVDWSTHIRHSYKPITLATSRRRLINHKSLMKKPMCE